MEYKDYYKIMGVDKKATAEEIKTAYRRLARKYHPDVNPGNKEAEAKFKEINEAYEVLGNEERRRRYDQLGAYWKEYEQWQRAGGEATGQPFDWSRYGFFTGGHPGVKYQYRTFTEEELQNLFGGESPFSSFFYTFFGSDDPSIEARDSFQSRTASRPQRGRDIEYPIEISLEEAYNGATRIFHLEDARGKSRRIEAKIPAGVQDGARIRLAGQGGLGIGGGPAGDLYLVVHILSHHLFERQGDDLHLKLSIPLTTAILGGEVSVPNLNGRVVLKIPTGTQDGQVFRLKGKGMPKLNNPQQHGDLFVEIHVALPQRLTEQERKLFEELRRLQGTGRQAPS